MGSLLVETMILTFYLSGVCPALYRLQFCPNPSTLIRKKTPDKIIVYWVAPQNQAFQQWDKGDRFNSDCVQSLIAWSEKWKWQSLFKTRYGNWMHFIRTKNHFIFPVHSRNQSKNSPNSGTSQTNPVKHSAQKCRYHHQDIFDLSSRCS